MYIDDCRLKGVVNLVLRDENGKVKQHKTIRNKVTRDGIAHIIGRMIDDGQDRAGLHKMPRMMSHMAVGIGAAARSGRDKYTSTDFDSLLQTNAQLGVSDSGGTVSDLVTARKQAAIPKSYDKRLQDERGFRSINERYYSCVGLCTFARLASFSKRLYCYALFKFCRKQ